MVPVCTRNSECPQPGLCLGQNCVCQFGFGGDTCATLLCDYDLQADSCTEVRCYPKPLSLPLGSLSACGPITSCNATHCCATACAEARSVPVLSLPNVTSDTVSLAALTPSQESLKTQIGLPDALSEAVLGLPTSIGVVFRLPTAPTQPVLLCKYYPVERLSRWWLEDGCLYNLFRKASCMLTVRVSVVKAGDVVLTLQTDRRTLLLHQGRPFHGIPPTGSKSHGTGNASTTMVVAAQVLDLLEWHVAAVAITSSGVSGTVNNPAMVAQATPTLAAQSLDGAAVLSAGVSKHEFALVASLHARSCLHAGTTNTTVDVYLPGTRLYLLAKVDRPLHALDLLVLSGARIQAPSPASFSGTGLYDGRTTSEPHL